MENEPPCRAPKPHVESDSLSNMAAEMLITLDGTGNLIAKCRVLFAILVLLDHVVKEQINIMQYSSEVVLRN